jgi:hypothetical protein
MPHCVGDASDVSEGRGVKLWLTLGAGLDIVVDVERCPWSCAGVIDASASATSSTDAGRRVGCRSIIDATSRVNASGRSG